MTKSVCDKIACHFPAGQSRQRGFGNLTYKTCDCLPRGQTNPRRNLDSSSNCRPLMSIEQVPHQRIHQRQCTAHRYARQHSQQQELPVLGDKKSRQAWTFTCMHKSLSWSALQAVISSAASNTVNQHSKSLSGKLNL